jgi:phospholipid/cholesterol/gamma-HCH transport system permease protein
MNVWTRPLVGLSSVAWFVGHAAKEIGVAVRQRRAPVRGALFFEQAARVGAGSVPLVSLVSLFLGITTALLVGYQLERLGAEQSVPGFIAVSFTRELGALLTGIVVAARSGAAFTAELGTMTVSEEVDAIEGMGIGPYRYLVVPRILASVSMLPALAVVSNIAAIVGGAFAARIGFDISFHFFRVAMLDALVVRDIWAGVVKSVLFGAIIGIVGCYKGLTASRGATGVGIATTSSVVTATAAVIGCDTLCNIVLIRVWD